MSTEATTLPDLFSSYNAILTEPLENASYLNGLPSLPLSDLLATPTTLSTQSHTLTASLNALAHTSYPTILSLHNTSSALLASLSSLDTSLHTLLNTALPALDDVARTFREKNGPTVIEERQRTRVVLEQYDKLRDLLDVPVLMDTCVRNGLYAEALALAGHATTALSALSATASAVRSQQGGGGGDPPNSASGSEQDDELTLSLPLPLVSALQAEIASSLHAMRVLLLGTLHEPGRKLPTFWKAIQFLRRMQVMPESELALAFVSARIDCLRHVLQALERDAGVSVSAISNDRDAVSIAGSDSKTADREKEMDRRAEDVARFLKKYIDVWREGAYDLVTQYTTMFLERSSSPHGSAASSHLPITVPLPDPVIKHTLPVTLLGLLLPIIQTYLARAYPHLAPLATQLAYCSSAMARIGMDFRLLLSPLTTRAVIDGFSRDVRIGAEREWSAMLAKHTPPPASASKPTPPSKWLVSSAQPLPALSSISLSTPGQSSSATATHTHTPPQILTAFTPLAVSLNTYLRTLNRLRALVPVDALDGVRDALEVGLAKNGEALLAYARMGAWQEDSGAGTSIGAGQAETTVMRAVGTAYIYVFVPFLRRAVIEGVFGVAYDGYTSESSAPNGHGKGSEGGASALGNVIRDWENWLEAPSS
ncbi:Dor1-like family-domain-containing protein [Chiua virens]|nr:Dor1-like family-domain-containing protein [Chiua virens]